MKFLKTSRLLLNYALSAWIFCLSSIQMPGQSLDDLLLLENGKFKTYYSEGQKISAEFSAILCESANEYFAETLSDIEVPFQLLVLSKSDWPLFTHSNLIYGMPHFKVGGKTLVVAAEDNDFWRRQVPDPASVDSPFKELIPVVYSLDGEISGRYFFDLLAVHELSHAWHGAAGLKTHRKWLSELFCNIMLHTFIAEKFPDFLWALEVLPAYWSSVDLGELPFTALSEFDDHYTRLSSAHPFNYAWYQYRFHRTAKLIYDEAGPEATKKLWDFMVKYKETLSDEELVEKLGEEVHPYFKTLVESW